MIYQYTTNKFNKQKFHFQKYIVKSREKTKKSTKKWKTFYHERKRLRIKIKRMYMYQYTTNEFNQTFFHFQKYIVKSRGKTKKSTKGKTFYHERKRVKN